MKIVITLSLLALVIIYLSFRELLAYLEKRYLNLVESIYEAEDYEGTVNFAKGKLPFYISKRGRLNLYLQRAAAYDRLGRYKSGLRECYQVLALDPDNAWAHNISGSILFMKKSYQEALSFFNNAIRLNGHYAIAYYNRGLLYEKMNSREEALEDFGRAYELAPDNEAALFRRARLYQEMQSHEKSLLDFKHLIETSPENAGYYCHRAISEYSLRMFKEAERSFFQAYKIDHAAPYLYYKRAYFYYLIGNNERAEKDYDSLFEFDEERERIYSHRANFYYRIGAYEEGLRDIRCARALSPVEQNYIEREMAILLAMGNESSLRSSFEELKSLKSPNTGELKRSVTRWYLRLGEYSKALATINSLIDTSGGEPQSLSLKALILSSRGGEDRAKLLNIVEQIEDERRYDQFFHFDLTIIKFMVGDYKGALSRIKMVIGLNREEPYNYFYYYIIAKLALMTEEKGRAVELIKGFDKSFKALSWPYSIASYLTGEIRQEELRRRAGSNLHKLCEANFYIAIKLFEVAPLFEIKEVLERTIKTGIIDNYEYSLARYFLNNFDLITDRPKNESKGDK